MDDPLTVYADCGDIFVVRDDTEMPGVMIDKYQRPLTPQPHDPWAKLDSLVSEAVGDSRDDTKEPIDYLIVPHTACRKLGEALIAAADRYEGDWKQQVEDDQ